MKYLDPNNPFSSASNPIKWRLQTYSGAPLGAHVIKPQIEAFNKAAHGEMEIELYYADQLVPTDELFRAMQAGTLDAVQSDDATMGSPVDISVFGGYFPFATEAAYGCEKQGCSESRRCRTHRAGLFATSAGLYRC